MNNEKEKKIQGIQSVENAFSILDCIKQSPEPLTLSDIARLTNMSKSRVQKYIVSFLRVEALVQDKTTHTYRFGSKLLEVGLQALRDNDIVSISDSYLKEIRRELNQSSALNIWTQEGPVVVKYESSGQPISVEIQVGYRPPILRSATGKCFAAFMESDQIDEFIKKEIQQYNLDRAAVENELKKIRENGYSLRDTVHEGVPGGSAITAPVFSDSGSMLAVISIIGFSGNLRTEPHAKEVQKLKEITSRLSKEMSYH
ncbi:IclR family transcriptional regulator [Bacillus piscicola]|uniref:IclR family transcriptional regulator n=1 Tax=Bacillus piscicola TaxID=1632684 RepID=UPI001F09B71A